MPTRCQQLEECEGPCQENVPAADCHGEVSGSTSASSTKGTTGTTTSTSTSVASATGTVQNTEHEAIRSGVAKILAAYCSK